MKFNNVYIKAISHIDPDTVLSSEQMEKLLAPVYTRLKLPEGRLELQTGIKNRGYFAADKPSDISTKAALNLFNEYGINRNDIDLLIHSSVCRDFLEPSTASVVHSNLELKSDCMSFDLSNACLGFLNAMIVAGSQIELGVIKSALIVSGENSKPLIDETIKFLNESDLTRKTIKKYIANLTIGSAGVAFVLTNSPEDAIAKIESFTHDSDTSSVKLCQGDGSTQGLMMETDSEDLLHAGIKLSKQTWEKFDFVPNQIVCHQVGSAHRDLLLKSLELTQIKDHISYDQYGNTGSAACPLTMSLNIKNFSKNDNIAMLGIGSGLHSVMVGIKWM